MPTKRAFYLTPAQQKALDMIKEEKVIKFDDLTRRKRQSFEGLLCKGLIDWNAERKEYHYREPSEIVKVRPPVLPVKTLTRPPAEYGNLTREQTIKKYVD